MRYTAFALTTEESNSLIDHVGTYLNARLCVITDGNAISKKALGPALKRAFKVTFMDAALRVFESDALVSYDKGFELDGNQEEVPTIYFWMNDKPIAKRKGATQKGDVLDRLVQKDPCIDRIMEETMTIGKSHAEYVSEILYVAYLQAQVAINDLEDSFWTDKRKAHALEELEDVYGLYLIDPVSHGQVA